MSVYANIFFRDGSILRTGLFKIDAPAVHESTALTSDATNIRELELDFVTNKRPSPCRLYVSHGSILYHFNYFIKAFKALDRVEVSTPWLPSDAAGRDSLTSGIATGNSYLKSTAKLSSVIGYFHEIGDIVTRHPRPGGPWDQWFWQADEGCHLRTETTTLALR